MQNGEADRFAASRSAVPLGVFVELQDAKDAAWKHMGFTQKEWEAMGLAIEVVKYNHKILCSCPPNDDEYVCDACKVMDLIGAK